MKVNEKDYKYLLRLYSQVDDYLADIPNKQENLPEIIVAFCITTEKIFKIKLHSKNPVLVYENSKTKDDDALISIIKEKELNIETIKIRETLSRYNLMFVDEFSDDEIQVLIDIYNIRNHFVHGYKPDNDVLLEKENLVKKMGTVWEKISVQAVSIFGKDLIKSNKPKKKYSEEELEKVLIEEVKKKIQSTEYNPFSSVTIRGFNHRNLITSDRLSIHTPNAFSLMGSGDQCPRCDSFEFYLDSQSLNAVSLSSLYEYGKTFSDLYKFKNCNLELTKKEYEIAKKLKK